MLKADWRISSGRLAGQPYTFDAFPCQIDMVRDEALNQVVMKSAQMAVSELFSLARPYWAMDELGVNWGVMFPTQSAMRAFFNTRMKAANVANSFVKPNVTAENENNISAFGRTCYLRYTSTESAIATFDASGITVDEQDLHEPDPLYGVRVSRSQGEMEETRWYDISTPSYPNTGIHHSYMMTDQKVWMTKCGACNYENVLSEKIGTFDARDIEKFFLEFLSEERFPGGWKDFFIPCSSCGKPIDPVARLDKVAPGESGGRWVKRFQKRESSGYHLQIFQRHYAAGTPQVLNYLRSGLMRASKPEHVRRWWNTSIGLPFIPKEGRLDDEDLRKASTEAYDDRWHRDPYLNHVMQVDGMPVAWLGVDVRDRQYHLAGLKQAPEGRYALTALGWAANTTELHDLWERLDRPVFLIDALPDTNESRRLVDSMHHRGWRGKFTAGINTLWQETNDEKLIVVNRPRIMEIVNAYIKSRQVIMPRAALATGSGIFQNKGDVRSEETFADHLKAPIMVKRDSDLSGNEVYDFPKDAMGGIDPHYYMALSLAIVATELRGAPGKIIIIPR